MLVLADSLSIGHGVYRLLAKAMRGKRTTENRVPFTTPLHASGGEQRQDRYAQNEFHWHT